MTQEEKKSQIEFYETQELRIKLNKELQGIEIKGKLSDEEVGDLKAAGFRWSRRQFLWYAKQNVNSIDTAFNLMSSRRNSMESLDEENIDDSELEKLIAQQDAINLKIQQIMEKKKSKELKEEKPFDAMEYLMGSMGNEKEIKVDNKKVNIYNTNHTLSESSKGGEHESNESSISKTSESKDTQRDGREAGAGADVPEFVERPGSAVGGNAGSGYSGTGYGNDISREDPVREIPQPASGNGPSFSGGFSTGTQQQDGNGSPSVHPAGMPQGGMVNGIQEHSGGDEPTGNGPGLLTRNEKKNIRLQVHDILESKKDSELTPEDINLIRQYEGGGGLGEKNTESTETLYAFYTPEIIRNAVWQLAKYHAPNAKTVLEPTAGTGKFADGKSEYDFTLREINPISARIAKILHPEANVIPGAFQSQFFDENGVFQLKNYDLPKFDIVIGNPPYGEYTGEWKGKGEGKNHDRYEEYFIEKGLDSLKDENSLLAFVVPSAWLRSGHDRIKTIIGTKGTLVEAYRLPNNAFSTTDVGTDIIIMKKNPASVELEQVKKHTHDLVKRRDESYENPGALDIDTAEQMELDEHYDHIKSLEIAIENSINEISDDEYFLNHPDHILGIQQMRNGRFGPEPYVSVPDGTSLEELLNKKIMEVHSDVSLNGNPGLTKENLVDAIAEKAGATKDFINEHFIIDFPKSKSENEMKPETVNPEQDYPSKEGKPVEEIHEEPSKIQLAFERYNKKSMGNPLTDPETFRNIVGEDDFVNNSDMDVDLENDFTRRDYARMKGGGTPWKVHKVFDLNTKSAILYCRTDDCKAKIIAECLSDGDVIPHFNMMEYDSKQLTSAQRDNLMDMIGAFGERCRNMQENFLGYENSEKGSRFFYRNRPYHNDFTFFDSAISKEVSIDSENQYYPAVAKDHVSDSLMNFILEKKGEDFLNLGRTLLVAPETVYSNEEGIIQKIKNEHLDIATAAEWKIEDMPLKNVEAVNYDARQAERSERNNNLEDLKTACIEVLLAETNFNTLEEYQGDMARLEEAMRNERTQKLVEKHEVERQEADLKPLFDIVIENDFNTKEPLELKSERGMVLNSITCSTDPEDIHSKVVFVDEKPAFKINEKEHSVSSFNDFPVTSYFLHRIEDKWNHPVEAVENLTVDIRRLNLDEMIPRSVPEKTRNLAEKILDSVFNDSGFSDEGIKECKFEGNFKMKVLKEGFRKTVFFNNNSPAVKVDLKANKVTFLQDVLENSLSRPLEEILRKKFRELSVTKDFVINGKRYLDYDGWTMEALPEPSEYVPEKKSLMNNEVFASVYGKKWNEKDRVFWEVTDYKNYVDLSKLTDDEKKQLLESDSYVTECNGKIMHRELFASGDIYSKLEANENYYENGLLDSRNYDRNKKILEEALPEKIPLEKISVSVISRLVEGMNFDGVPMKDKFIMWATRCDLEDSPNTLNSVVDYTISNVSRDDIPSTIDWSDVYDYVYNKSLPAVRDSRDESERKELRNQKMNDRKETAEKLFMRFLQNGLTAEEKEKFVYEYNRAMNHNKEPDYSKIPVFVNGMNGYYRGKPFALYEQQLKSVSFLCNKGNGLLALDVGLGKTACGIVATNSQMQAGRCSRPLIVVPKSVIGKWERDIHEMFPDTPLVNLGNLSKESVGEYYDGNHGLRIPEGTITLVTKEALNNLYFGKEYIDRYLFKDYADLLSLNDDLKSDNPRIRAAAREKIYEKASMAEQVRDMFYIQWDKAGFDHVTVDEAHAYKNLFKVPRPKKGESNEFQVMGSGEPSTRALKMFNITQIIQQENDNRNVFMLTATPFTNSPMEIYSMLTYVARKEMENAGIKDLGDFCRHFAKTQFERIIDKGGKDVKFGNVMKSFNDLPALQNILNQYIEKVDGAQQEKESIDFIHSFVRPKKETHKSFLKPTQLQEDIFNLCVKIMNFHPGKEALEKRQRQGKDGFSPVLEGINMMRTACLSPAMIDQGLMDEWCDYLGVDPINLPSKDDFVTSSPKLQFVCDAVISNWKKHNDQGQVIYIPEGPEYYEEVIKYMTDRGVPREVFAEIDGQKCVMGGKPVTAKMMKASSSDKDADIMDDKRTFVAEKFNDPSHRCKILIGSSAVSEGIDLNGNSIALYNCMLGWNPTESLQVEGRIWRQGNRQGIVHIVYPLMYDSVDALMFQKHNEKKDRINELFSYKDKSVLNVDDINPEELKYALIKDPLILTKMELEDRKLEFKHDILILENQLVDYDKLIENRLKYTEKLAEKKLGKEQYIENYRMSVREGNPRRSEEEQKRGEERFDRGIKQMEDVIEGIKNSFRSMGIETRDDESLFVNRILQKKEQLQKEIDALYDSVFQEKLIAQFKEKIRKDKIAAIENEITSPIDKEIQENQVSMESYEYQFKKRKYERFLADARKSGDSEMEELLNSNWEKYEEFMKQKHPEMFSTDGPEEKNVEEKETAHEKEDDVFELLEYSIQQDTLTKYESAVSAGMLFPVNIEPDGLENAVKIISLKEAVTLEDFSSTLKQALADTNKTYELVNKVVSKMVSKMSDEDKKKLQDISKKAGVNTADKSDRFFMDIADGKIVLDPGKKPPVVKKNQALEMDDIF